MTSDQMVREMDYRIVLALVREWAYKSGLNPQKEGQFDTILAEYFSPVWGHLSLDFVDNTLL